MVDIDPEAEIRISVDGDQVSAMLPLDGPVTDPWRRRYDELAKARGIPARVMPGDRAWIAVSPVPTGLGQVEATMDAARQLITEMQASEQAATAAEGILREWWARQRT